MNPLVDLLAETCDLLMPDTPAACTASSTRAETPPIQAATSAFSDTFRASRKGGK